MKSILVTGVGIVSALGTGKEPTWHCLYQGESGIAPVSHLRTIHNALPVGEVALSNADMCAILGIDTNVPHLRTSLMGMIAIDEALKEASLADLSAYRVALLSGTTVGGMDKTEDFYQSWLSDGEHNDYISIHDCGSSTELIADHFGGFSPVTTISTACSSAANAIMMGGEMILSGRADIVVTGGSEALTRFHLNGFNTLKILDAQACRPFDRDRAGLNLGEGAGYLVLESEASSSRRGVRPLCRLAGYANTCDAFHQTASSPEGTGAFMAMKKALECAGIEPHEVDYINAHGTGTPNNDVSEGRAIMQLFGSHIPPVSSTKPMTGHATSAAGGLEAVVAILALQHGWVPANLNFRNRMEELSFAPVASGFAAPLKHILSNSFGFGGNDTSLVFSAI